MGAFTVLHQPSRRALARKTSSSHVRSRDGTYAVLVGEDHTGAGIGTGRCQQQGFLDTVL